MSSRRWTLGLVLALACGSAYAQPETRDHRDDHDRDHRRMPPPPPPGAPPVAVIIPTAPPPPPQAENPGAKPGHEWVAGRWDWRGNKWEWLPGRWEPERHGQHWHPGKWEQKDKGWVYVEGAWGAGEGAPMPPPPPGAPPGAVPVAIIQANAPPPPPQVENPGMKPGHEWVPGRWDWRGNKWEWLPGRWEKEHAGQHWRPGRWEQRQGGWAYIEGTWGAPGEPPPGVMVPPGGPPMPPRPPHEWHLDRPVVSSYWPTRGKDGRRVAIRGRNFPPDIAVIYAGQQINGAKVTPDEIVFEIPKGAPSGEIELRRAHGRDLPVGAYEVVATGDPDADWKRLEEERRKRAEAQWLADQKAWAKDKAAREAAWRQRVEEMERTREERREAREREIRAKWDAAFLADPDTQSELTMHAQRVAELARAKDIAQVNANTKLGVRIDVATQRENDRHDQRMAALKATFGTKGGPQ